MKTGLSWIKPLHFPKESLYVQYILKSLQLKFLPFVFLMVVRDEQIQLSIFVRTQDCYSFQLRFLEGTAKG